MCDRDLDQKLARNWFRWINSHAGVGIRIVAASCYISRPIIRQEERRGGIFVALIPTLEAETPLLLLADVHLGADEVVDKRFMEWVRRVPDGWTVVSLGDLVDAWVEGPRFDMGARFPALAEFRRFRSFFLHGNRDFLIGPRWQNLTGGRVLGDRCEIKAWGKRFLCLHGDTLLTRDRRYQAWRRVCRSRLFAWAVGGAGRTFADRSAQLLRKGSAAEVARKPRAALVLDREAALRARGDHDILVCGHTHTPERSALGDGELIVLGAWDRGAECVRVDGSGMRHASAEALLP